MAALKNHLKATAILLAFIAITISGVLYPQAAIAVAAAASLGLIYWTIYSMVSGDW